MKEVYVARDYKEKATQRALLQPQKNRDVYKREKKYRKK
jgi:hypothetical protein